MIIIRSLMKTKPGIKTINTVSAQAFYEDMTTDMRSELAGITAPVLVLVPSAAAQGGEASALDFYRKQYAGAPHLAVQAVADSGHFIMLDQPEAFAGALNGFLR